MTTTRVAMRATMPRSWVISTSPMANSRCNSRQQVQDLRLNGDIEGGGRLVRQDQRRLAHQSHGDHDALAQATGELVRVLLQPAASGGDADALQKLDGAGAGLPSRDPLVP